MDVSTSGCKTVADLPYTAQREIIRHVDRYGLLRLQRVSKHFHQLASEKLYGILTFRLAPTPNEVQRTHPTHHFAEALQTITSSEHDYAQYVKGLSVEPLGPDPEANQRLLAIKYQHEDNPGKLMNTLLSLFLRKAKSLEGLRWTVPIELSSSVYETLSRIESLQHVVISLDTLLIAKALPSIHPPPPQPPPHAVVGINPVPPAPHWNPLTPPPTSSSFSGGAGKWMLNKPRLPAGPSRKLSAFKYLRSLDLRGIDDFICTSEIASCIKNSSPTLRALSLSISRHLVRQTRNQTDSQPGGSSAGLLILGDEDQAFTDDDHISQAPPFETGQGAAAATTDINKLRYSQLSFLSKVFGLEPMTAQDREVDKMLKVASNKVSRMPDLDIRLLTEYKNHIANNITTNTSDLPHIKESKERIVYLLNNAIDDYLKLKGSPQRPEQKSTATAAKNTTNKKKVKPPKSTKPYFAYSSNGQPKNINPPGGSINHDPDALPDPSMWPVYSDMNQAHKQYVQDLLASAMPSSSHAGIPQIADEFLNPSNSSSWPNGMDIVLPSSYGQPGSSHTGASALSSGMPINASWPLVQTSNGSPIPFSGSTSASTKKEVILVEDQYSGSDEDSLHTTESIPMSQAKGLASVQQHSNIDFGSDEVEDMGIDMEHPSDEESFNGSSEEDNSGSEVLTRDATVPPILDKGKGKATIPRNSSAETLSDVDRQASSMASVDNRKSGKSKVSLGKSNVEGSSNTAVTVEETMQSYLLKKHGHSLESLTLYLTPIKSSVLAKALDFSNLRVLSLLSVGPQGALWTLMKKMQVEGFKFNLRAIQTDDVSLAFLHFIADLPVLQDLHLLKRRSKDLDCTTEKVPASLDEIRTLVLRKHAKHLVRLSIVNHDTSSNWDLDKKCARLLASVAENLKELATSIDSEHFHAFLQALPKFKNLTALHITKLPNPPSSGYHWNPREVRRSIMDILSLAPRSSLRILVIVSHGFRLKEKISNLDTNKDAHPGAQDNDTPKTAASAKTIGSVTQASKSLRMQDLSDIENESSKWHVVGYPRFAELEAEFRIFKQSIRTGRL